MKKLKFALHTVATCAIAALTVACSNDENSNNPVEVTLTAYQPGNEPATRLGFDSEGKACWQTNDAIGVWSKGEGKFNSFAIASGAGEGTATFSGTVTGGVGEYAVYPYNENHSLSGNQLTYSLPDNYTYDKVGQTVLTDKDGNSFYTPMFGKVNGNEVAFKHLGGVICLKIDKMPAESGTVKVTEASNKLCGAFTANLSDEAPEIKTEASEEGKTATFTYSNATVDGVGVFYLPVATGTYNLTIEVAGGIKLSSTTATAEMTRAKAKVVKVTTDYEYVINGHKFIDLGLPSGLLWAETNVGAETATDYGNYYAWGETETKTSFGSWKTYKLGESSTTLTKYNSTDKKTVLESEEDVASVKWSSRCRIPTQAEFAELFDTTNCTWTWTSKTISSSETVSGYTVKSKKNGKSIFIPASGCYQSNSSLINHNSVGFYWSSTLNSDDTARAYYSRLYESGYVNNGKGGRFWGLTVRPVAQP